MRPPQPPQLPVWRLCRMLPWFWAARTPPRVLFCFSCGRARPPRIELSSPLCAATWRPISSLIAGPFWSRICSVQRVFSCHHGFFFSSHIGTSADATTPTRDSEDSWTASVSSKKTDEAAALSGVGGCPPAPYTFMLQHDWCTSKRIVPCSLFGRSRRVGWSRCVGKKNPAKGQKKRV